MCVCACGAQRAKRSAVRTYVRVTTSTTAATPRHAMREATVMNEILSYIDRYAVMERYCRRCGETALVQAAACGEQQNAQTAREQKRRINGVRVARTRCRPGHRGDGYEKCVRERVLWRHEWRQYARVAHAQRVATPRGKRNRAYACAVWQSLLRAYARPVRRLT